MTWKLLRWLMLMSLVNKILGNFENFSKMVKENIIKTRSYIKPIDNSEWVRLTDSEINDFGSYDFIIIGAGSAGTVLANRLSERKEWNILLLEAGEAQNEFTDIPGAAKLLENTTYDWGYLTVPQKKACLGNPTKQCHYLRGKGLGGSSIINYMAYVRGNREDFDLWGAVSNGEWNYNEVLPYFKKSERFQIWGDEGYHGKCGELAVNYTGPNSIYYNKLLTSMKELNLSSVDFNGKTQYGYSRMQANINFNKRASGARAFIDPIRHRKNLTVKLNCFVTKVLFDKTRTKAEGADFIHKGKLYKVTAKKEIILSAGSINTPQILMLSGVGPKEQILKHGIEPVKYLEKVGEDLKEHPLISLTISTNLTQKPPDFEEALKNYYKFASRPFNDPANSELVSFVAFNNSRPDLELLFLTEMNAENFFDKNFQPSKNFNKLIFPIVLLHPQSSGTVRLQSKDPKDFPLIDMNLYSDPEGKDMELVYRGIRYIQKILQTDSMKSINAKLDIEVKECNSFGNDTKEYWYCAIPYITDTTFHPMGTTIMGLNQNNSVVDSELKVHGFKNLRIVDAGVFPNTISGHLNAAVYMTAERTSDIIKKSYLS